jgi:hypothetical protein|tara:strand:+ start:467 stop:727 length:261 start_codon:yes stop_codon:yes gene_type:complete
MPIGSRVSAAEEDLSDVVLPPTTCYPLAWNAMCLNTGQAVKLFSGTKDTAATIKCFLKAYASEEDKGLGLPMGFAVNLCKNNSEPF